MMVKIFLETILNKCSDWDLSGEVVYATLPVQVLCGRVTIHKESLDNE
jgi:hypothetical protein